MKRMFKAAAGVLATVVLIGCGNADYQKTASGVIYKIHKTGKGETIKPGQWIKVHFKATVGDSTLVDTYGKVPAYGMFDTTMRNAHDFVDFLGEMRVGDSAVYVRSIDSLQKKGFVMYNDRFRQGGTIKGSIVVLAVLADQMAVEKDRVKEFEAETAREVAGLEKWLKEQNITGVQKTANGVFVKIEQEGTGAKADSGLTVSVNYTGTLKNGTKFDSNVDPAFGHVGPFEFVVGTGGVIRGWDEAIPYFKKGSKGKLYIPAMLAYGANANGEKLPGYSDLVFDIEVMDVKQTTAAAAPAPGADPHGAH